MCENSELPIFLRGKKVVARPLELEDVPNCQRWVNAPDIRINILNQRPLSMTAEKSFITSLDGTTTDFVLAICLPDGRHIGNIGLHRISYSDRTAVTGCIIGDPEYRNKGYGHDAKMILLAHAFLTLNLRKINSAAKADNLASLRFNEKCGYEVEGIRKAEHYVNGRYVDEVLTAVFREKWEPLWEAYCSDWKRS